MSQLDNLHRRLQTFNPRIIGATVPCSLEPLFQIRAARFLETEYAGAGLVEVVHEADVEVGCVCAESEIDVGQCMVVAAVDDDGAACRWPEGAVGNVGCLVDVRAWGGQYVGMLKVGRRSYMGISIDWLAL